MIKNLLCTIALIVAAGTVHAHESCKIELKPRGIYYRYCPPGTLMEANATWVNIVGNSVFVRDQIRCAEPVIVCDEEKVEELVDTREKFEDN